MSSDYKGIKLEISNEDVPISGTSAKIFESYTTYVYKYPMGWKKNSEKESNHLMEWEWK